MSDDKPHIYNPSYDRTDDRRNTTYYAKYSRAFGFAQDNPPSLRNLPLAFLRGIPTLEARLRTALDGLLTALHGESVPANLTYQVTTHRYSRDPGPVVYLNVRADSAKPKNIMSEDEIAALLPWSNEELVALFGEAIKQDFAARDMADELLTDYNMAIAFARHIADNLESKARNAARIEQKLAALHAELAAEFHVQCRDSAEALIDEAFKQWSDSDGCHCTTDEEVADFKTAVVPLINSYCQARNPRAYSAFPGRGSASDLDDATKKRWLDSLIATLHPDMPKPSGG